MTCIVGLATPDLYPHNDDDPQQWNQLLADIAIAHAKQPINPQWVNAFERELILDALREFRTYLRIRCCKTSFIFARDLLACHPDRIEGLGHLLSQGWFWFMECSTTSGGRQEYAYMMTIEGYQAALQVEREQ